MVQSESGRASRQSARSLRLPTGSSRSKLAISAWQCSLSGQGGERPEALSAVPRSVAITQDHPVI
jgi:hypothetical protein